MKEQHEIFLYFISGFCGLIVGLFILKVFSPGGNYAAILSAIIIGGMAAIGLLTAKVLRDKEEIKDLSKRTRLLEEDHDSKSKFLSFASHELRKPLTVFEWSLSGLLHEEYGRLLKEQRELLQSMHTEAEMMEKITETFLNLSKMELQVLEITLTPVHLEELEKEITALVGDKKVSAAKKGVEMRYVANVDSGLFARVNKTTLHLVVENLLENAVNYTPSGGTISAVLENSKEKLIFRISDTGIGIPQEKQAKIFHEFFRAENAKQFQESGSGIGLYLCKKYIDGHGGTISFSSQKGKGSTFTFTLPIYASGALEEVLRKI